MAILVAYRLAFFSIGNRILVLRSRKIIERGTNHKFLQKQGEKVQQEIS